MKRLLLSALALALCLLAPGRTAAAQGYVVVVNAASSVSTISKAELSNVFLKKSSKLTPVDQQKGTAVRDAFSKTVLGRPASAVATYWQQQIFAGKDVPPPEKGDDAAVLAFVKSTPNGVGYVSAGADVGGVKTVTVQ
jgi:ABC-type phosphate transport system substrate-binding protein